MLGDFFLCDLTLSLENLHHLDENFQFNVVWHRKSVAALLFYRTLAESIITVIPSVTCMDWLCWWCKHAAHVVASSTALAFVTNVSEKHKSTSVQMKNQQNIIGVEEKLDIISQLQKGDQIVDICRNVRLTHCSILTVYDNADKMKEVAK